MTTYKNHELKLHKKFVWASPSHHCYCEISDGCLQAPCVKSAIFHLFYSNSLGYKASPDIFFPIKVLCVFHYKADMLLQFLPQKITMSAVKAAFALLERYCSESATALSSFSFLSPPPVWGSWERVERQWMGFFFCFVLFFHGLYSGLALIRLSQKIYSPLQLAVIGCWTNTATDALGWILLLLPTFPLSPLTHGISLIYTTANSQIISVGFTDTHWLLVLLSDTFFNCHFCRYLVPK